MFSAFLLSVAAQDLHTQGDVVDPAPWMDAQEAAKQRWLEQGECLLIGFVVSWEELRKRKEEGKYYKIN